MSTDPHKKSPAAGALSSPGAARGSPTQPRSARNKSFSRSDMSTSQPLSPLISNWRKEHEAVLRRQWNKTQSLTLVPDEGDEDWSRKQQRFIIVKKQMLNDFPELRKDDEAELEAHMCDVLNLMDLLEPLRQMRVEQEVKEQGTAPVEYDELVVEE